MLSEKLTSRFWLARPWFALSFVYAAGFMLAALFVVAATGPQITNYQHAFLFNSGALVLLWAGLLIARPKPSQPRPRTVFAVFEYILVGLIFSLAWVLFSHHGWYISASAPAGFAAIAWGIGWIAVWLGPVVLGLFALLFGHWMWFIVLADYRRGCWGFVEHEHIETLLSTLQQQLQLDGFLREKDAQYVGRKLIQWQLTKPWKPFELDLPSSGAHLHGHILSDEAQPKALLSLEKRCARQPDKLIQSLIVPWPDHQPNDDSLGR